MAMTSATTRRHHGFARLGGWWSRTFDPVWLDPDSPRWRRHGPALGAAAAYALLAGSYIVISSSLVSGGGWNLEVVKGLVFVAVTALLLLALLVAAARRSADAAQRFRALIEATGDVAYRYRNWPTPRFEYVSPRIDDWVGLTPADFAANPDIAAHLLHPDDRHRWRQLVRAGSSGGPVSIRWVVPDGRVLHTEHDFHPVRDRRGRVRALDGRIRNVTEARRDRAEADLGIALAGWLAEEVDLEAIVTRTCDAIVRLMGVETAWIGVPLADGSVRIAIVAGDLESVAGLEIRWDDGPLAIGPTGRAIREREPVVMRPTDPGFAAWRHRARSNGVTAALAVPILWRGHVAAVLTVFSRFGNPFDDANVERFDRIARRLAMAVAQLPSPEPAQPSWNEVTSTLSAADLRAAIADDRIEVWWQPQVAGSGRIVACEALVRLRATDGTLVMPDAIIPAAEESGLMVELGRAVRRQAVEAAAPWLAAGLERICVNISVAELLSPGFEAELEDLVGFDRIRPDQLELELVETAPLDGQGIRVLSHLVAKGFRVAVDDYGSGWASLGHLARIPAMVLKIDRIFVRDVAMSERARALVSSTFELGHVLGLETVAEGVETVEQAQLLCEMGCDLLQGYLFSPPVDRSTAAALLAGIGTEHWPRIGAAVPDPTPTG